MALAQKPLQPHAFAQAHAVAFVQGAEIIAGLRRCHPLQDPVGHFHQRDLKPQLGRDRRGFQPNVATADDQNLRAL